MASVHVVGAGPAGSAAAFEAARAGHRVFVSEEHPCAGTPVDCSGLISKKGLDSLSDIAGYRKHVLNPIRGSEIDCAGHTIRVSSKSPAAFVVDRGGFDAALAESAESEGAEIFFNERVNGNFRAENIIGADGPLSQVASHFSFPCIKRYACTMRAFTKHSEKPDSVKVFLSNRKFPGFFGWLIPHNEEKAEVGVGTVLPNNPREAFSFLLSALGAKSTTKPRAFLIPLKPRRATFRKSGKTKVMLAGDAAGQVKSISGGGVVFGTSCARIAGNCIETPEEYEKRWKAFYGKELSLHHSTHLSYSLLNDWSIRQVGRLLSFLSADRFLSEHGDMDKPTSLLTPELLTNPLRSLISK